MRFSSNDSSALLTQTLPVMAHLFNDTGAAVFLFDDQDRLLYANQQYYDLICHEPGTYPTWPDIIRDNHARGEGLIIETDDIESWIEVALGKRRAQTYRQFEIDAWDGRWLLLTETLVPRVGLLGIGVDITQAKNMAAALRHEYHKTLVRSETDLLTDMGNRRALEQLRNLLVSRAQHHHVTALMIDIDRFKSYNDTLGHLQGDECLQQVARVIQTSARVSDAYPIRLGGDEFLVLMLDAPLSLAQQMAATIRQGMLDRAIPHPAAGTDLVTLSIGLAGGEVTDSGSFSTLLKEADDALYEAKRRGRDRIADA